MAISQIQSASLASGVPASSNMPAGSVLQVVQGTISTQTSNSTQTFADTGLTATITPKFSNSKILILINHTENAKGNASAVASLSINLCRNGTQIQELTFDNSFTNSASTLYSCFSASYYDSPATTSATTYKTQFRNGEAATIVYVQTNSKPSNIILMEIAQ